MKGGNFVIMFDKHAMDLSQSINFPGHLALIAADTGTRRWKSGKEGR